MDDVAGCADSVRNGAAVLPVAGVEELAGTADIIGAAETDGIIPVVPPIADMEVTGTAGVPGAICRDGVEQVTTVPGVVGSEASGTGANVVSGTPGWVVAENGLGPLSGEITIAPGVDESPMAVVPIVETCARLRLQPNIKPAAVNSKCRIDFFLRADLARLRLTRRHPAAFRQVDHRIKDDLIPWHDAVMHFDFRTEITRDRDLLQMSNAILDHGDMQPVLIEYNRVGRYDHRWRLARNIQLDGAINPGAECAVRIGNVDLGQQRTAAGLQCAGDSRDLAGKAPIRNLGDTDYRIDAGPKSESLVLRDEHLGSDHIRVHQSEHEGRSGRHQAAVVDVALCDHAVEWRYNALVGLLLLEDANLGLLGGNIRLSYSDGCLLCLQGQAIVVALLKREPSLRDQLAVTCIGDLRKIAACLRLLQCRLVLGQRRLGLRNLVVEFGGGNVRQQGSRLDPIADIDVALFDVAAGARENIRRLECRRGRRQGYGNFAVAGANRGDANVGNSGPDLLRGGRDGKFGLVMTPAPYSKAAEQQQHRSRAEQRASVTTSPLGRRCVR